MGPGEDQAAKEISEVLFVCVHNAGRSQAADVVITMGCGDACPIYPGKRYEDWELEDPAGQDLETVRKIRDEIQRRIEELLGELAPR